ncbi:MAG: hypothetical protein KME04_17465 [Pleurocapsa minor GSE-CHR-MK-17-07R]|jgi:hypothetical protein|nr:hypothetical protein [Pleurocapsa minor GSE-CHR-MK 17-07R]
MGLGITDKFHVLKNLESIGSSSVVSVKRVFRFVDEIQQDNHHWPVQIEFDNGSFLLFDAATDGMSIKADVKAWEGDPVLREPNEHTLAYVREYGYLRLVNVSDVAPYSFLMGRRPHQFEPIVENIGDESDQRDRYLAGIRFYLGEHQLIFIAIMEECRVLPDVTDAQLDRWSFKAIKQYNSGE